MIPFFRSLTAILAVNYPNLTELILIYSVPRVVGFAISVVKKCVDKEVGEKFKILTGNGTETPKALLEFCAKGGDLPGWARPFHKDLFPLDEE